MPNSDLYSDSYYESLNGTFVHPKVLETRDYGAANTFFRATLVLLLRAGYVLVQLGSVPTEKVYVILLQNIVDVAVAAAAFGLVGFILAFGKDVNALHGAIGYGRWIVSNDANLDNAVLGFCACLIGTAIITTFLSGRVHFVGYFFTTFLYAGIFQAIVMHWIWHDEGWMHKRDFANHKVSVKDHAGDIVIHITAGIVGLIGCLFLGRRLLKLSDIGESSIGAESPGSTLTGYVFIILGLISFSLPTPSFEATHIPGNYIGIILVNNIMAIAAGIFVVVVLQFLINRETFHYWIILRCMQGAVAGLVSIAAGIDVYTPIIAFAIAALGALLFYFVAQGIHSSSIEDYCHGISIHLICGLLGAILPPLLGSSENLGTSIAAHFRILHFGWQILCCLAVIGLMLFVFTFLFTILYFSGFLRNKSEEINHRRGVAVSKRGPNRCCLQRLFKLGNDTPHIEPGPLGKSPDQVNTFIKSYSKSKKNVRAPTSESLGNMYVKDSKETNKKKVRAVATDDEVQAKKPRLVYTLHNIVQETPFKEDMFCAGDFHKPKEFHNKIYEIEPKISNYRLHRTKKSTNICAHGQVRRKNNKRVPEVAEMTDGNEDGIVFLKVPAENFDFYYEEETI